MSWASTGVTKVVGRCSEISFFFSSRRRHTRCLSDWSSDVCSSDLKAFKPDSNGNWWIDETHFAADFAADIPPAESHYMAIRSEERRVGKECRSRGLRERKNKRNQDGKRKEKEENWR